VSTDPGLLASLWTNQAAFADEMTRRGRPVASPTPIVPIRIGGDRETMAVSKALFDRGVFAHGIRPPSVPEGTGRLRLTLMASHTPAMLATAADALDQVLTAQEIARP
jgi:7-keto-8-aminopelargonate synthetase-like enzyme